jgi:hypothetical protein
MVRLAALALLGTSIVAQTAAEHQAVLERLGREADAFERNAFRVTGTETLRQTVPAGVRFSRGPRGILTSLPERTVEIVSQYGFISVDERGGSLKEVRSVLKVDGLVWNKRPQSLAQLARELAARDEKARRKSLENFESHGLYGFVSDLGQLILLFARGNAAKYEIAFDRADEAGNWVYRYAQLDGHEAFTVYGEGDEPTRQKLKGRIWVQPADKLPVRVSIDVDREVDSVRLRDVSTVEYAESQFGCLLPARVVHQQFEGTLLLVTDVFEYSDFRQTLPRGRR